MSREIIFCQRSCVHLMVSQMPHLDDSHILINSKMVCIQSLLHSILQGILNIKHLLAHVTTRQSHLRKWVPRSALESFSIIFMKYGCHVNVSLQKQQKIFCRHAIVLSGYFGDSLLTRVEIHQLHKIVYCNYWCCQLTACWVSGLEASTDLFLFILFLCLIWLCC